MFSLLTVVFLAPHESMNPRTLAWRIVCWSVLSAWLCTRACFCPVINTYPYCSPNLFTLLLYPLSVCPAAGDLWLLSADDHSTLLDAVMESFRIHDRAVSSSHTAFEGYAC
jgi:hypothetical protein